MSHLEGASREARALRRRVEARQAETGGTFEPTMFVAYRDRPVEFVREKLGSDPEPYQVEILEACVSEPRVALRSGHGIGKTTTLAWVLLWWLVTRPFSRVLILAPAFERQVGRYVIPEVRKWARRAPEPLPLDIRRLSVEVKGYGSEWYAVGIAASDPDTVEGAHAESLCVIGDEAKGLSADVVAALHGTQTDVGGDRLYLLASTPGGPAGPFFDACRAETWRTFHVSCLDSARVSRTWIQERAAEWGEESPLFKARVLGEFPEEAEGTLFPLSDIEAAVGRELDDANPDHRARAGLDCAEFGSDWSVLTRWRGKTLTDLAAYKDGLDPVQVGVWASSHLLRWGIQKVAVDVGGVGSGTEGKLRELGFQTTRIHAGATARDPRLFARRNIEMAWRFREGLQKGEVSIAKNLPHLDRLLAELSAYRYGYDASGRLVLLKDEAKRMLGRSPDLADSAILGYSGERTAADVCEGILTLNVDEMSGPSPWEIG